MKAPSANLEKEIVLLFVKFGHSIFGSFFHGKLSQNFRVIYCLIEQNLLYKTVYLNTSTASGT